MMDQREVMFLQRIQMQFPTLILRGSLYFQLQRIQYYLLVFTSTWHTHTQTHTHKQKKTFNQTARRGKTLSLIDKNISLQKKKKKKDYAD